MSRLPRAQIRRHPDVAMAAMTVRYFAERDSGVDYSPPTRADLDEITVV